MVVAEFDRHGRKERAQHCLMPVPMWLHDFLVCNFYAPRADVSSREHVGFWSFLEGDCLMSCLLGCHLVSVGDSKACFPELARANSARSQDAIVRTIVVITTLTLAEIAAIPSLHTFWVCFPYGCHSARRCPCGHIADRGTVRASPVH